MTYPFVIGNHVSHIPVYSSDHNTFSLFNVDGEEGENPISILLTLGALAYIGRQTVKGYKDWEKQLEQQLLGDEF